MEKFDGQVLCGKIRGLPMKVDIATIIGSLLIFTVYTVSPELSAASNNDGIAIADTLSVSNELVEFKAERPDFSSNNTRFVGIIDAEIELLRKNFDHDVIDLEDEKAKTLAPELANFLSGGVRVVAEAAKIKKPGVKLQLQDSNLQYNAAAQRTTRVSKLTKLTYEHDLATGKQRLLDSTTETEVDTISDIIIGAELVRLFIWREGRMALMAAILGHEVGHIVFEHKDEAVANEHEADLFAAKLLKKGTDLIVALDMISLAAHVYNSLKTIVADKKRLYDLVRLAVNRVVTDVPDLGELGTATSHAYVATAVFNALKKADAQVIQYGNWDDALFEVYLAVKRACTVPSAVFGVPSEEIQSLCLEMERKATYLQSFKLTHPTPLNRRVLIEAISKK